MPNSMNNKMLATLLEPRLSFICHIVMFSCFIAFIENHPTVSSLDFGNIQFIIKSDTLLVQNTTQIVPERIPKKEEETKFIKGMSNKSLLYKVTSRI